MFMSQGRARKQPSRERVAATSSFTSERAQGLEIDGGGERLAQEIEIERIELIGRQAREQAAAQLC
jgi:hypothetical protein